MRNSEISVRLTSLIGRQVLVPRGKSVEEVQASIDTHIDKLREIRNPQHLKNLFEEIVATVDAQLEDGSFVRRFRGKELLRGIYRELALPNISYSTFCYRLAELVRNDAEASAQIESTFVALDSEVDTQLSQLLTRS
jgi:hypothetical protein